MKILVEEPFRRPKVMDIAVSLASMQKIIGGNIQATYPFDDSVAVITNDIAKLMDLPMNRVLRDRDGKVDDVLCGTFFICGVSGEEFTSLTDEQIERYSQLFHVPEVFLHIGGRIMVLQVPDMEGGEDRES